MKFAVPVLLAAAAVFAQTEAPTIKDLDASLQSLKEAEAKKDPDLVKKLSDQTAEIAQKIVSSPQPKEQDEDQVDAWKKSVAYAAQVNTYTEYSLYATMLQTADPRKKLELMDDLERRNPKSEYIPQTVRQRFLAYQQAGDNAQALAFAEKTLATDQSDPQMLVLVAYSYLQKKQPPEQISSYTGKIVELMDKPKPEGISDADWQKQKTQLTGTAHYIAGVSWFNAGKLAQADREFRAALPLLDNENMKAETLFDLGMANYKMQKIPDALHFNQQCAAIKSRYQAQAAKNVAAIRSQYRGAK